MKAEENEKEAEKNEMKAEENSSKKFKETEGASLATLEAKE